MSKFKFERGEAVIVTTGKTVGNATITDIHPHPFAPDWLIKPNYGVQFLSKAYDIVRQRDISKIKPF